MTNAFSSLKRVAAKAQAKAAPSLHTPPSSSPARLSTLPRAQPAKAPVKPAKQTSTTTQGKRSILVEESSSGEEVEEPAPKKKKKSKHHAREATPEPEPADTEDPSGTVLSYDPEGVNRLQLILISPTQAIRIENGVEALHQLARLLARNLGDDVSYKIVLPKGLARDGKYRDDDPELTNPVWDEYWQVRIYFDRIKALIPAIADNIPYLRRAPDLVANLAGWMTTIAGKARSDDLTRVKEKFFEYFEFVDIKGLKEKTSRGFKHPETARLLCPVTLLERFDKDPEEFCRAIRTKKRGRTRVTGAKWPLAMYDMKLYEPGNQFAGFLKSKAMLRFFQLIYTGPSSASDSYGCTKNRGKPPIASKMEWDDDGVHILTIVYVATLMRFVLNEQGEWQDDHYDFDISDFTKSVLTACLRDHEWRDELTRWYTRRVLERSADDDDDESDEDDEPSSFDLVLAEIEARKAAKALPPVATQTNATQEADARPQQPDSAKTSPAGEDEDATEDSASAREADSTQSQSGPVEQGECEPLHAAEAGPDGSQ